MLDEMFPAETSTVAHTNPSDDAPSPEIPDDDGASIYGTFFIGGNEFAVSVQSIQEVVNDPKEFTRIPLSPDYLLGLFNLRELIIPVVDLRTIFDLPQASSDAEDRKVAIIEHGEHCFGLLVDRTGDVFNAKEVKRSTFNRSSNDIKEAIVGGVFKLDDGKRLVQALDPFELLNLDKLPRVSASLAASKNTKKRGRRKLCIAFEVSDCLCAFEMTSIKEIVELGAIDNDALSHGYTLGAVDLRGSTVPVVDFRMFLGKSEKASADDVAGKGYKLIVMRLGGNLISLLVDSIKNIISYFDDDLLSFPGVGVHRREMFKGCLTDGEGEMVLLLDHNQMINNEELNEITRGNSSLFQEKQETTQAQCNEHKRKRTLISFTIGAKFALDIEDVVEVIEFPESIVRPPNMPDFVEGMVNLRGDLIPIINLRALYHLDAIDPSKTKLLIFSASQKKYGIMVDAVDSIENLSEHNSSVLPRLSDGNNRVGISSDVTEAILLERDDAENQSMMVLDLGMVISRSVGSVAA